MNIEYPDTVLRIILILWQCPVNANVSLSKDIFLKILRLIRKLNPLQKFQLADSIGLYPSHLFASRILKPLQEHLSMLIQTDIGNFSFLMPYWL
jgi:hypothetical protein